MPASVSLAIPIRQVFCAFLFFYLFPIYGSWASHIVGGQIEMQALVDKPGHFSISVTYYFDENQSFVPRGDDPLPIYRKRDNQYMGYVVVYNFNLDKRPLLPFANKPCASQRNLSISVVRYTGETQLNPEDYTDPQGYYITYQTCCRNGGIDNIKDPINAGYVFYLEFPPLIRQGKQFRNSSPVFDPIDGEYLCLNEPFTFDFDAHDPDGDELRYSLVTPLKGFQSAGVQQVLEGPYPQVQWLPGFGPHEAIPGAPPLRIDARSGQLSVTANRQGLFIFAVLVEEYRQGERIGAVQRDYQLLVVDCPPTIPPDATITVDNQPITSIIICEGKQVTLQATNNPGWNYQWTKNGMSIAGATQSTLRVGEPGTYQLSTSLKEECSKTRRSTKITVSVSQSNFQLQPNPLPRLCANGASIHLQAPANPGYRYQWYREGVLSPSDQSATYSVSQPGRYWAVGVDPNQACQSRSDTVLVQAGTPPMAQITSTPSAICQGDSLPLIAYQETGYKYQWQKDGVIWPGATGFSQIVRTEGTYSVVVIDSIGCTSTSAPLSLSVLPPLQVYMDSLPAICLSTSTLPVSLRGEPAGGFFSGPGVQTSLFNPQLAGPGYHPISYTVNRGPLACQQGNSTRTAVVQAAPQVALGPTLATWKGNSVTFPVNPQVGYRYLWTPPDGLDNPSKANAIASPLETTQYSLNVWDNFGCEGHDTITVRIYERIWIPDAFSPNGDGINDVWELRGIEAYPDAEVTIYNRWGEVVFYSRGYKMAFDGTSRGQSLTSGVYTYQLRLNNGQFQTKGNLILL